MTIRIDGGDHLRAAGEEVERAARERAKGMERLGTGRGSGGPAAGTPPAVGDRIDPELAVRMENLRAAAPDVGDLDAALDAARRVRAEVLARPEAAVRAQAGLAPAAILQLLES